MTLDQILRKYVAKCDPDVKLDSSFKLYIDADGDIAYRVEGGQHTAYIYTSESSELPDFIEFILNEAGIK